MQILLRAICIVGLLCAISVFSAAFGKHKSAASHSAPTQVTATARIVSQVSLKRILARKSAAPAENYEITFDSKTAIEHHGYNVTKIECSGRGRNLCRPATIFNMH